MLYEVELTDEYRVRGTEIVPEPPLPDEGEHDYATLAIASNAVGEHGLVEVEQWIAEQPSVHYVAPGLSVPVGDQ